MKSMNKYFKDKKGIFGLTAVQQFFAIILGLALLAYIIVIIMGTLSGTTILSKTSATTVNETGYINWTGYTLASSTIAGFSNPTIVLIINSTNIVTSANYTLTGSLLQNKSTTFFDQVNITYTYNKYTTQQNQLETILTNTSTGVSGFFSSVNPVYAILAVLVIILILVVIVRVVQAPQAQSTPQL